MPRPTLLAALLLTDFGVRADEVQVAVAANFTAPMQQIAAQFEKLLLRHAGQRGVVGFVRRRGSAGVGAAVIDVAHARAPIHSASPMAATIPMIHIAMPSGAGPKPPRP